LLADDAMAGPAMARLARHADAAATNFAVRGTEKSKMTHLPALRDYDRLIAAAHRGLRSASQASAAGSDSFYADRVTLWQQLNGGKVNTCVPPAADET
jgi:hypothetical protein